MQHGVVYNIMHNKVVISLQIKIADKSEDEIKRMALLSCLSLRARRRNKRHRCFWLRDVKRKSIDFGECYRLVQQLITAAFTGFFRMTSDIFEELLHV